ncbi:hypothetical protein Tco_0722406 [Tanacetum coccineum]
MEVELDKDTPMIDVTNIIPPINVDDEEDEITDEVFELRRRVHATDSSDHLLIIFNYVIMEMIPIVGERESNGRQVKKEVPAQKGNSGPEKIVLSLHKFPAIVFNDDDIEERTSRWVNKCIKKFNPYARYGVENWKNPHAKIFYIRRQKEPGRPKEEIYSNSKIVQVIKTYWELGHEHKFITEIMARRANDCIVSITDPGYKNLDKNDIEDMYLLIVNNKVPDYANTGLLWSLSVFIRRIEKYDVFSIVYEPVHGIIYTNSKKEKRVMRHSEIHKFCDATLRRTLEGLKSYNNDVKYGYVQKELTNDEVEFLKLFEEEIEVQLNYRDQMRR